MHNLYWNCEEGENCYIEQILPNWAVFNECFAPTKIKVSDIDGVVERKEQFLFIEVKQNTKSIQTGQKILFENLTRNAPHISVLLLYAQNVSKNMDIQEGDTRLDTNKYGGNERFCNAVVSARPQFVKTYFTNPKTTYCETVIKT